MKKFIATGLLLVQSLVFADGGGCTASTTSPVVWVFDITNNTNDTIVISHCTDTTLNPHAQNQQVSGYFCSGYISDITCNYEDQHTHQKGVLKVTFPNQFDTNCLEPQGDVSESDNGSSPTPFVCDSKAKLAGSTICGAKSNLYLSPNISAHFIFAEGARSPKTYVLTWDDVTMNLTQGQITATKLANQLLSSNSYITAFGAYDGHTITVKLTAASAAQDGCQ